MAEAERLAGYLRGGQTERLTRRLEADTKSLLALYEYGRLHRGVRLRWGFLDEMIPAPWVHTDEESLHDLKHRAHETGSQLEVVVGSAPGWANPWARGQRARVEPTRDGYGWILVDEVGMEMDDWEVQRARLVEPAVS